MNTRDTQFQAEEKHEHSVSSQFVDQIYKITVVQPVRRLDGSERFPVLYVTDADDFFDAVAIQANTLQTLGEAPRFIMVGIGYGDRRAAQLFRWRDFATRAIRDRFRQDLEGVGNSLWSGAFDMNRIFETTGAPEFLRFIREELMSFIDSRYPTVPTDSNYYGYSAGATFGLYTLFSQPDTFQRYILGSPGTSRNGDNFGIELVKAFIGSGRPMAAKVYLSAGELEDFKPGHYHLDLASGYVILAKFLKQSAIPGLNLRTRMFPDETHATAWTSAFNHGVKALFGPATDVPYYPQFIENT